MRELGFLIKAVAGFKRVPEIFIYHAVELNGRLKLIEYWQSKDEDILWCY